MPRCRRIDENKRSDSAVFPSDAVGPAVGISKPVFLCWVCRIHPINLKGLDGLCVCLGPRQWSAYSVADLSRAISKSPVLAQHSTAQHSVLILFGLLVCFAGCISCILSVDQQILGPIQKLLLCPGIITLEDSSLFKDTALCDGIFLVLHPSAHLVYLPQPALTVAGVWSEDRAPPPVQSCFRTVGAKQRTWREPTHIQEAR